MNKIVENQKPVPMILTEQRIYNFRIFAAEFKIN